MAVIIGTSTGNKDLSNCWAKKTGNNLPWYVKKILVGTNYGNDQVWPEISDPRQKIFKYADLIIMIPTPSSIADPFANIGISSQIPEGAWSTDGYQYIEPTAINIYSDLIDELTIIQIKIPEYSDEWAREFSYYGYQDYPYFYLLGFFGQIYVGQFHIMYDIMAENNVTYYSEYGGETWEIFVHKKQNADFASHNAWLRERESSPILDTGVGKIEIPF
jgi:hypothetical protein